MYMRVRVCVMYVRWIRARYSQISLIHTTTGNTDAVTVSTHSMLIFTHNRVTAFLCHTFSHIAGSTDAITAASAGCVSSRERRGGSAIITHCSIVSLTSSLTLNHNAGGTDAATASTQCLLLFTVVSLTFFLSHVLLTHHRQHRCDYSSRHSML